MTIKQHGGVFGRNPSFNDVAVETLSISGTALSSTAAELNILDGVTADATEINYLDGASTAAVVASKAVLADASGNIAFPNGKGIDFSATSDAGGMTSELLDDYEEGTWTPTVVGGTTAGDYTVTPTGAFYTKVGRFVHASAAFTISENSAGTGDLRIGGLPFSSLANSRISGSFLSTNATFDAACVYAIPAQSTGSATTIVHIKQVRSATSPLNIPVTALASTSIIELQVNYTTS